MEEAALPAPACISQPGPLLSSRLYHITSVPLSSCKDSQEPGTSYQFHSCCASKAFLIPSERKRSQCWMLPQLLSSRREAP